MIYEWEEPTKEWHKSLGMQNGITADPILNLKIKTILTIKGPNVPGDLFSNFRLAPIIGIHI